MWRHRGEVPLEINPGLARSWGRRFPFASGRMGFHKSILDVLEFRGCSDSSLDRPIYGKAVFEQEMSRHLTIRKRPNAFHTSWPAKLQTESRFRCTASLFYVQVYHNMPPKQTFIFLPGFINTCRPKLHCHTYVFACDGILNSSQIKAQS